MPFNPIWISFR